MKDSVTTAWARYLGVSLIVAAWVLAAYLVVYYAILIAFGPERLYAALGERAYNALFPSGGFVLVLSAVVFAAVWAVPLVVFFVIVAGGMRLVVREKALRSRRRYAGLAAMLLTAGLHFALLDGWPWAVLPYLGGDDTEFAPTYSALGFWSIRAGLTRDQVVARAGEPLERYPITDRPHEEGWRWTRSPHSGDYRVRVVVFRDGRVVSKVSEYYLD